MWRCLALSLLLARPGFADVLIGPELPLDDLAAKNLSVLTSPKDAAFAIFRTGNRVLQVVPIENRQAVGSPVEMPCAVTAASGPEGALVLVRCSRGELGTRFV